MLAVYCAIAAETFPEGDSEIQYTNSPLTCLSLAEVHRPEYVIIRFPNGTPALNRKLFELCDCLKRDARTREIPLLGLLRHPHRKLIEALQVAQVRYLLFFSWETPDITALTDLIGNLPQSSSPALFREAVCPYLDYEVFNTNQEIALCGAYLDHLVINPQRMQKLCSRAEHRECCYFLKPKIPHEII